MIDREEMMRGFCYDTGPNRLYTSFTGAVIIHRKGQSGEPVESYSLYSNGESRQISKRNHMMVIHQDRRGCKFCSLQSDFR